MNIPTVTGFDPASVRERLDAHGYVYLTGLPGGFDYPGGLSRLGPLVPQYGGDLVRDVRPDPAVPDTMVSSANMGGLTPHTEWYEFPGLPPRYVALWCVHAAEGRGGETTLADGYALLERYSTAERERLARDVRRWRSRPALAREGVRQAACHAILEMHAGVQVLRFSTLDMVADDDLAMAWVASGRKFFDTARIPVRIKRGDVLVWDNWRMLHARNAFTDSRRHLRRVLIGTAHQAAAGEASQR